MFGGLLIAIVAAAIIYAQGLRRRERRGRRDARFGVLLGVFVILAFSSVNYATLNIGRKLAAMTAAAGFVEVARDRDDHRAGLQACAKIGAPAAGAV